MEDVAGSLEENLPHEKLPTFPPSSTEKIFCKRAGTTDMGKKYQNMIVANIVLQMISNDKVKNFYVSSDDSNFGAFDDVVIEMETDDEGTQTRAIQLKHSSNAKTLALKKLANDNGNFSLLKYFKSFQGIKKKPQQCILVTNQKFKLSENTKFQLEGKDFFLEPYKTEIAEDCLKVAQDINYCHKFRIVEEENDGEVTSELQEFKTFLESFSLHTNQQSLYTLEKSTANNFTKTFCSNRETFEKYVRIISEWDMLEGSKIKLDKKLMQRAIALCLVSPYVEHFTSGPVSDKRKILREAICSFDITLLENTECDVVKELWDDLDKNVDIKELNRLRSFYRLSPNYISKIEDVDGNVLAQLLWLMEKRPLIVKEHENIEKAIQLCPDGKFVLLGEGKRREWMKGSSVFQNLLDLKSVQNLYERVIQNFTISLQGKAALTLMDACGGNEEFLKNIIVNNLLEMIDSPRLVDGAKEVLPNPYIERYLSLNRYNYIDIKYLEHVNRNTVVILNCADSSNEIEKLPNIKLRNINDYLNEPDCRTSDDPIFIISKNKCGESEFEIICSETPKSKTIHYFRFLKNNILEWVRSRGDVGDLHNYKLLIHSKNENEFWSSEFRKSINLVIGDPGMGKTELTKSLKNKCSPEYWTVIISPQDVNLFFEQSKDCKISDYANLFQFILDTKFQTLTRLDKEFFKMCSDQLRVFYVWDALDEISTKYLEDVSDLIVVLSKKGFMQWVTSRKHLKPFLEKKFNTFSLDINQFNEYDQDDYIRKRFSSVISANNIESTIQKVKSSFALIKHVDILGIPLQIYMLTEIVLQNNDKYLKLFGDSWRLIDLYHYFIEEKFNIFYQNKKSINIQDSYSKHVFKSDKEKILTHYEKLAVDLIFSDCEDIKCQEDTDSTHEYETIGIITGLQNHTPVFLHASFAEYLTAVYLSKNLEVIPGDRFFERKYNNVRFFFDMLLAKNSPVHTAVLYRNFDALKSYDDKILTRKDVGGRNALHLICSWGQRHSRLTVRSSKINRDFSYFSSVLVKKISFSKKIPSVRYSLDDYEFTKGELETREYLNAVLHLFSKCNISEPDELFKMTPLSYARVSESLGVELELLQSEMSQTKQLHSCCDRINILYYSSFFGYENAIKTVFSKELSTYYDEVNFISAVDNDTALTLASKNGHTAVVECLLDLGTEINRSNKYGWTPLYAASFHDNENTVECLVTRGAKINHTDNYGRTPLYAASSNGHKKTVEYLVKCGAQLNRADDFSETPLYVAYSRGHEKIVEFLVKCGAETNSADENGRTVLHAASSNGDEKIVEYLVKNGAEVNRAEISGETPLEAAASNGHYKTVEYLAKCGAEINRADKHGRTPLYAASLNNHEKTVKCLVNCGAEIDSANKSGWTPFYAACENGHETIVEFLVTCGADISRANINGWTPLFAAASNGHERIVDCLVKSGAEVNRANKAHCTPLYAASENGHETIVEFLVKCGAEVNRANIYNWTPLNVASSKGHENIVQCLVKSGAEINHVTRNFGETPLYIASENGYGKIVEYLVKCGAEINRANHDGWTPLKAAYSKGHEKVAEYLAKCETEVNHADEASKTLLFVASSNSPEKIVECLMKCEGEINRADENGETLLYTASSNGSEKIVELLVKSGAEINRANTSDMTPLYVASSKGNKTIVELLVKYGADINRPDKYGWTPLSAASSNRHDKIIEFLVKCGGEVNQTNEHGETLLYAASSKGHEEIVECLLKCGAKINRVDNYGRTPLFAASSKGHQTTVELLAKHGAAVDRADENGWTPLFAASSNGHDKIVEFLAKCGGEVNCVDEDGETPLFTASCNGHEKVVECLVKCGAEVNRGNNSGETPLYIASCRDHDEIVTYLMANGAKK